MKLLSIASRNGGEGNRTPDLVNAIHALSQLSYAPGAVTGDAGVAPTLLHIAGDMSQCAEHAFPSRPTRRVRVPQSAERSLPRCRFPRSAAPRHDFWQPRTVFRKEPLNVSVCMSGVNQTGLAKILSAGNLHDFSVNAQQTPTLGPRSRGVTRYWSFVGGTTGNN